MAARKLSPNWSHQRIIKGANAVFGTRPSFTYAWNESPTDMLSRPRGKGD